MVGAGSFGKDWECQEVRRGSDAWMEDVDVGVEVVVVVVVVRLRADKVRVRIRPLLQAPRH